MSGEQVLGDSSALVSDSVERSAPSNRKALISKILRPVVSIALLAFLFRGAQVSDFAAMASKANPIHLGIGFVLVVLAVVVSAYKWQRLLVVQEVDVPLTRLFSAYLIGLFFNNFLPTNIGGDVVRIHDIAKYSGKNAESVASVIGERLLAAFALALTAALGLVLSYQVANEFSGIVAAVFLLTLAIIAVFANKNWRTSVGKRIGLPNIFSLRQRLANVAASMSNCLSNPVTVAWVLFYSIVFHLIVVLINYFIFLALGLNVPLVYCLLFIPIISAIQMLPVSISGLGVREGAYVYFFGWAGLSTAEAVTSSLIFWILVAVVSLAGGVIFATRR